MDNRLNDNDKTIIQYGGYDECNHTKYIDKHDDAGMNSKIFGPPLWKSIFFIVFGYPVNPTDEQKNNYKIWLTLFGDVMPCKYCRESYKKHLLDPNFALTD